MSVLPLNEARELPRQLPTKEMHFGRLEKKGPDLPLNYRHPPGRRNSSDLVVVKDWVAIRRLELLQCPMPLNNSAM